MSYIITQVFYDSVRSGSKNDMKRKGNSFITNDMFEKHCFKYCWGYEPSVSGVVDLEPLERLVTSCLPALIN